MRGDGTLKTRKVQQLGSSTLGVTVPAEWVRRNGIEKGDDLVVQRDEGSGSLLLVPDHPRSGDEEVTIDAGEFDPDALGRTVVAQYVLGRQFVRVEDDDGLDPECLDTVLDVERRLMGLGVVEEGADYVTIRCSVAPDDFDLPTLLGRIGRTEATMRTAAVRALAVDDTTLARRTVDRRTQVEKLFFLFLRLLFATYRNPRLNRSVGIDTGFPLIGYRSIAQDTVLMADAARDLARLTIDRDVSGIDDGAMRRVRRLSDAVDDAASASRTAAVDPSYDSVTDARTALSTAASRASDANEYLDRERPEPLLTLQRAIHFLSRDNRHVRDTLDVAAHLAFRDGSPPIGSE